jgi:Zn-dependent protease with chaperone function
MSALPAGRVERFARARSISVVALALAATTLALASPSLAAVRAPAPAAAYDTLRATSEGLRRSAVPSTHRAIRSPAQAPDTISITPILGPRDYLAEARQGFTQDNREYQRLRVLMRLISPLVAILVGLALVVTGLAQRYRDLANRIAGGRWGRMLAFYSLYVVTIFVVLLPLSWFNEYALEQRFGFAAQTPLEWLLDQLKSVAFQIVAVGVVPVLALAWRAVELSPRRWWLWLAAGTLPVLLASVVLQPLVFDPLFNKFTTLHDEELRADILALGARAHVPARNVFEVDMSEKTTKVNAYVSGFGGSQRIVLWDNTLRRLQRDEILFVMGHEMGHYVLQHVWKGVLLYSLGAFAVFWIVSRILHGLLRGFGERWGIHSVADLAAMPLLFATLNLVAYVGAPITNAISRRVEHEADVFALEITHDNDAGARSFLALARDNKSDPEPAPWVRLMLYSHPPLGDRIRFALEYKPWEKGEPNRAFRAR